MRVDIAGRVTEEEDFRIDIALERVTSVKKRQLRQEMRIGTWNVRTMTIDGKIEMVEAELERMRIGCLSAVGGPVDRERPLLDKQRKPDHILRH